MVTTDTTPVTTDTTLVTTPVSDTPDTLALDTPVANTHLVMNTIGTIIMPKYPHVGSTPTDKTGRDLTDTIITRKRSTKTVNQLNHTTNLGSTTTKK